MSRQHSYAGSCHCGNLELRLDSDKTPMELGTRTDTCSFCNKHHALYTSDPVGELHIAVGEPGLLERYRFATETADFLLCKRCGVLVGVFAPEASRAVVNINVLDARPAFLGNAIQVADLDGESWLRASLAEPPGGPRSSGGPAAAPDDLVRGEETAL